MSLAAVDSGGYPTVRATGLQMPNAHSRALMREPFPVCIRLRHRFGGKTPHQFHATLHSRDQAVWTGMLDSGLAGGIKLGQASMAVLERCRSDHWA